MGGSATRHYHVVFTRDPETDNVVAEIPALQIADFQRPVDVEADELRHQLGCLPNMIQPPLGGVVNAASAVSARTVT